MFRLYFGELYVPVLNHYPVVDKLSHETGITCEKLNYWIWQTYPEKSYGKFLVSEAALYAVLGALESDEDFVMHGGYWDDGGSWIDTATWYDGSVRPGFCDLTVSDFQGNLITFQGVSIKSIMSWNMGLNSSVVIDGNRLLVIELELERVWYDSTGSGGIVGVCGSASNVTRRFSDWNTFTNYLFGTHPGVASLAPPKTFNRYINYHHVTPSHLAASVASMNGYVAFPSATNPYRAEIGYDSIDFDRTYLAANQNDLIYVEQGSTLRKIVLNFRMLTVDYKKGDPRIQNGIDYEFTEVPTTFYQSTALRNETLIQIAYPWELYDPDDPLMGGVLPTRFYALACQEAMLKKLQTDFKIVCKGVYDGSLNQTLNYLEYSFARGGMITTLATKEFKIHTFPFIDGLGEFGQEESIFIAQLLTHMDVPLAFANIYHVLNPAVILYAEQPIYDPLNLVTNYCAGTKCYVYKTLDNEFVVISGPCPPTEPCESPGSYIPPE